MTLEYIADSALWSGEPISGIRYPLNIEALWSADSLSAIGLRVRAVAAPSLDAVKAARIAAAWAEATSRIDAGTVSVTTSAGTHTYGIDFATQDNISKATIGVLAALTPNPRPWTPKGATTPISVTHDDIKLIASAIGAAYDAHVQAYLIHKSAILSKTTAAEVAAYSISGGWPS